jgi:LPS O-antigen subunit length determinant protein (WzzB/FepE family)
MRLRGEDVFDMLNARRGARQITDDDADAFSSAREMSGIDFFVVLYRQKWIVFGTLALCMALAVTASLHMTPKYEAVIVMAPTQDDNSAASTPLAGNFLLGLRTAENTRRDIALAALDSRSFLEGFITEQNLLPSLFPNQWDASTQYWLPNVKRPTLEQGYSQLHAAIRIEKSTTDNVVRFVLKWPDANLAAAWANGIVAKVNGTMRAKAIATADSMISYLNSTYTQTTVGDVRVSIANLIEQEIKQRMIAQSRADYALDVISPAEPTAVPAGPGLLVFIAGGAILGLLLGIPAAFLRQSVIERRVSRRVPRPAEATGD